MVIYHHIGKLQIQEISVLVAVEYPRGRQGIAACRYTIDTLKHNAPIWKKEFWADFSSTWVSVGACKKESFIY